MQKDVHAKQKEEEEEVLAHEAPPIKQKMVLWGKHEMTRKKEKEKSEDFSPAEKTSRRKLFVALWRGVLVCVFFDVLGRCRDTEKFEMQISKIKKMMAAHYLTQGDEHVQQGHSG